MLLDISSCVGYGTHLYSTEDSRNSGIVWQTSTTRYSYMCKTICLVQQWGAGLPPADLATEVIQPNLPSNFTMAYAIYFSYE